MNTIKSKQSIDDETVLNLRRSGTLSQVADSYRLIDLFAGAGGMTLGFSSSFGHVFNPVWANDFNESAVQTYNANFNHCCTMENIEELIKERIDDIPQADVLIGGPPCQGFSLLNKQRSHDQRKQLWRPFLQIAAHTGVRIFVMENVPQLIGSAEFYEILSAADSLGFKTAYARLCAADYGVPQTRWRAFIVGCTFLNPGDFFPPKKTHRRPDGIPTGHMFSDDRESYIADAPSWRTVRDAIADLPNPENTQIRDVPPPLDLHFGRSPTPQSIARYQAIPEQGMNRFDLQKRAPALTPNCWLKKTQGGTDLFGRLWWDRPAFTIRTEFFKPEKGRYLHPVQHRPLTHREAARLQSFPDSFKFCGSKNDIAKQIGNAVPPPLSARIADCVLVMLMQQKLHSQA